MGEHVSTSLNHLKKITDRLGVIQHCKYSIPDPQTGFCLDDNARALIAAAMHYEQFGDFEALNLARIYLEFLNFAQRRDGRFHNFFSYGGQFLDQEGSEDSFGRAIWACGYIIASSSLDGEFKGRAYQIFMRAFPHLSALRSIRSQAFSVIGLYHYLKANPEANAVNQMLHALGDYIYKAYGIVNTPSWHWFENKLTYCNARLPQALYLAYETCKEKSYLQAAEEATFFLVDELIKDDKLIVAGNKGWYCKGGKLPYFDQQPVDAGAMVELFKTAFEVTGQKSCKDWARICYEWFIGRNILNTMVCDPETGACYDGIEDSGLNRNQGAESTICYLMANLNIKELFSAEPNSKIKSKGSGVQGFEGSSEYKIQKHF